MTDQALIIAGAIVLALLLAGGRYAIKAIASQVVSDIGDSLQERWQADIDEAVAPIIEEVTVNGGGSLKDRVIQLQKQVEAIITDG